MKKLIAFVVVALGVGLAARGGCLKSKPAPDEQLVSRIEDVCKIARDNVKTPNDGVTAMGTYLGEHAGHMYKHIVDTVVMVAQITDDDKLETRGKLARKRWIDAGEACAADFERFAQAVQRDPKASERVKQFMDRLERAIDVIFDQGALRDMPRAFTRYLTTRLRAVLPMAPP